MPSDDDPHPDLRLVGFRDFHVSQIRRDVGHPIFSSYLVRSRGVPHVSLLLGDMGIECRIEAGQVRIRGITFQKVR